MKTMKGMKRIVLLLALLIAAQESMAQVIVRIRPARPRTVIVRPPMPRPGCIWIEEEWVPHGHTYIYKGGYWAVPPRYRAVWVPGHWQHRRHGYVWIPGRWR